MSSLTQLYFSALIIVSLELILMMYIYMLQPQMRSNRLFAVYMFLLAASSFSVLVIGMSPDLEAVFAAAQVHTLANMVAAPLLWLLVFTVFIPQHLLTRYLERPLLFLAGLPLLVYLLEKVTAAPLLFVFDANLYAEEIVSVSQMLNGRLGNLFYWLYFILLNSLLVLPIAFFAFSRFLPDRMQKAARVLLIFAFSVGFLYLPWFDLSPTLRTMLAPIFAAVGAAWIMRKYRFFSPMELATKQAVDTVTIGLLVFDERLNLMDANAFAVKLLALKMPQQIDKITLPQLLAGWLPRVVNQDGLLELQTAVKQKPNATHQQEIILRNEHASADADDNEKTWLLLTIRPIYDENRQFLGCSCTVEDVTVERRTQNYITEAHKAIEQYAYNQALLNEITQAAIGAFDFDESMYSLASRLTGLFKADQCYISLWDKQLQQPKAAVAYGEGAEIYLTLDRGPKDFLLSKTVCRQRQPMAIEDLYTAANVSQRVARTLPSRGLLALPMTANDEAIGALMLGFTEPRQFSPDEVKFGEQIARQLSLAIAKSQSLATEQEQRVLLEALQTAGQALISTLDFEQVLDRILDEIARVVPYDTVNFAMIHGGEAHIVRRRDFGDFDSLKQASLLLDVLPIAKMPTLSLMYQTKRPLRIPDTAQSQYWTYIGHIKSWMGVPIIFGDEPVAFLMVDKVEPDFYQPQHEKMLVAFANHATLALKHAQLFTEIQRRVTELEALSTVSAALRSSDTIPNILQSVLQVMVEILSAKIGVAFLLNEAGTAVTSQASYPANFYPAGISYALGEGITGYVAQTGNVHISREVFKDALSQIKPEEPSTVEQLRSTIALPLVSESGLLGVIHLGLDTRYDFAEDEVSALQAMCNIVANGLQRIQLMQTLEARVAERTFDLEMANERLQELDKLKTKFIADVSHELRTPVANLSIYINLLENGNPAKHSHYIKILQQQAMRLTNLVEATLSLSQLEIDPKNQAFGPVDLNPIIEEVMLGHQARADAFGITLAKKLQLDLPPLLGNKTQLAQLITNLVTNGIHYNEKQGEIILETFVTEAGYVCLKVADDGIGIGEEEIPHLFDRFYRGQRTGQSNIPGSGLGLAIVKEIVELHRGEISVESRVNEGTVFMVLLPVYQSEEIRTQMKESE